MKKTYTLDEIEAELGEGDLGTSRGVLEQERRYAKMLADCDRLGLTPHPLWLSDTGRFTMAAIVAAALSGDREKVLELQRQWEAWAGPQPE